MHEWYAAPMEGAHRLALAAGAKHEMFGRAALYVTPFVSPNGNFSFQRKELEELDPGAKPGYSGGAADPHQPGGVLRLGCQGVPHPWLGASGSELGRPSGTVTGKKKGSGLLRQPELLRQLLDGIFDAPAGYENFRQDPYRMGEGRREWPALLALLETYPICRLTVHPRVRTQFYKGTADREVFRWTAEHTALPLCYNGDVTTVRDLWEMGRPFPTTPSW